MNTADEVITALNDRKIVFDAAQTRAIYDAYRSRNDIASRNASLTFNVGDKVEFDSKRGHKTGTITRVNVKSISVQVIEKVRGLGPALMIDMPSTWKVHPSFLTKVI